MDEIVSYNRKIKYINLTCYRNYFRSALVGMDQIRYDYKNNSRKYWGRQLEMTNAEIGIASH
jgi:hypothetical protein